MKKKNGFTVVELVIVIAIIAILAAVLLPTFSLVIDKAHQAKLQHSAKSKFNELYAIDFADGKCDGAQNGVKFVNENDGYTVDTAQLDGYENCTYNPDGELVFSYSDGEYISYLTVSGTNSIWDVHKVTEED